MRPSEQTADQRAGSTLSLTGGVANRKWDVVRDRKDWQATVNAVCARVTFKCHKLFVHRPNGNDGDWVTQDDPEKER